MVAIAPQAAAAVTCSYDSGSLHVATNADLDLAKVARTGEEIAVLGGPGVGSDDQLTKVACAGAIPTVTNTDSISIEEAANVDSGAVEVDLSGGPFAPGATEETDGTSEIEIEMALNGDEGQGRLLGSPAADAIAFGLQTAGVEANLNATAESQPDTDLTVTDSEIFAIVTGDGPDEVTALGGSAPQSFFFFGVFVAGGPAADVLIGGSGFD